MNKLQKKILIFLIILTFLTPIGVLLPIVFDAGDAWGEWSAETLKDLIGYVPEGLQKYTYTYDAPLTDYSMNSEDQKVSHQSGYYLISGIIGAALTLGVTVLLSKIIIRK